MTPSITATVWGSGWRRFSTSPSSLSPIATLTPQHGRMLTELRDGETEGGAADQIDFAAVSDVVAPPSQTTVLPKHHCLPGEDTIQAMSGSVDTWAVNVSWPERDAMFCGSPKAR